MIECDAVNCRGTGRVKIVYFGFNGVYCEPCARDKYTNGGLMKSQDPIVRFLTGGVPAWVPKDHWF